MGALAWLLLAWNAQAGLVTFYDHGRGLFTATNAVDYGLVGSGPLKDISTGLASGATVTVTNYGAAYSSFAGIPDYGTPASVVFDGYVDFGGQPNPGLSLSSSNAILTYTFSGLDPNSEYNFQGTGIRGDWPLTNQWALYAIVGATSFTSAHSAGALTTAQVPTIASSEVAINTGNNVQGVLAWWEHIQPAAGGTFSVVCRLYTGPVPNGSSAGGTAYAINGFRFEKAGTYSGRTQLPPRTPTMDSNHLNGVQTVFVIMLENKDWGSILGSTNCPYLNSIMPETSFCTQFYSPRGLHPSEANYLWLLTGTNFGIRDDNLPNVNHQGTTNTLFNQMDQAGITWRSYQENISGTNVPDTNVGQYVARHNPYVFFDTVRTNLAYCTNHVRPYGEFDAALINNTVARFNFLTPNLTNDMHSLMSGSPFPAVIGELRQGDHWLSVEVPKILASQAYQDGGALFITWDESTSGYDGPCGMMVLSPRGKGGGYSNSVYCTHSAALRTFQNIFGLRPYLGDAAYSNDLSDLFQTIQISAGLADASGLSLSVTNVIPGRTNWAQVTTGLGGSAWVTFQTNVPTATWETVVDADAHGPGTRFYRVVESP